MSELTDFLLARIAEDEEQAHELIRRQRRRLRVEDTSLGFVRAFSPRRIAAECEAKRAIATLCGAENAPIDCEIILSLMTLPYAEHPDYREEWKP